MAPDKTIVGFALVSLLAAGCAARPTAPATEAKGPDADAKPAEPGIDTRPAWAAAARFSDGLCANAHADASVVVPLYAKACAANDGEGCWKLGARYVCGAGVIKNASVGTSLIEKGCSLGDGKACELLGVLTMDGNGVTRDTKRAHALLGRACELGVAEACGIDGMALLATGDKSESTRGIALVEKACNSGVADHCANLGAIYEKGIGTLVDETRAAALATKACEMKSASGCSNLAAMYVNGYGPIPKDAVSAARLFTIACDADNALACGGLAQCYWSGIGVREDKTKAVELLQKGCEKGAGQVCRALADVATMRGAPPVMAPSGPGMT